MNILVTGGGGYIGSHTCKALSIAGIVPVTYDNFSTGHRSLVKWGPCVEGDIRDRDCLDQVLQDYEIEGVIHFAAVAYVGDSALDPGKYYDINVNGTITVLNAMRAANVKSLVFSSSCATYGNPDRTPISEASPQSPISPYGRSKLMGETIINDFCDAHNISAIFLRYFNAAGADRQLESGECHNPETHLIPLAIKVGQRELDQIVVFGNDYDTPDGTCIRDYVHVTDLADAHVRAIFRCGLKKVEAFNLGAGFGTSVREIIAAVSKMANFEIEVGYGERRKGDPTKLVSSIDKARDQLGWNPVNSDISTIVNDAWRWNFFDRGQ